MLLGQHTAIAGALAVLATSCSALMVGADSILLPCPVRMTVAVPQQVFTNPGETAKP